MRKIQWLKNRERGRCAAVLGGGPSLPGQLGLIPDDALLIAVNHHAAELVTPDYVVYLDKHGWPLMKDLPGLKVTGAGRQGDIILEDVPLPRGSAQLATWLACWLGCWPVLLAGMDCYQGATYFYEGEPRPRGADKDVAYHLTSWKWCGKHCDRPERIASLGGPTERLFGLWDGKQRRNPLAKVEIEILKRHNEPLNAVETLSLHPGPGFIEKDVAKRLQKDGIVKIVNTEKEKEHDSSKG